MRFPDGSVVKNPPTALEILETWFRSLVRKIPLEEEMATHFSILAGKTPQAEEPGGLPSVGPELDTTEATGHACARVGTTWDSTDPFWGTEAEVSFSITSPH